MSGCKPGCVREQGAILAHWRYQTYNAGCYNPGSVLDGTRTPSPHALGEAYDIGIQPPYRGHDSSGQEVFLWLYEHRVELGIVQLIYSGQIWSASHGDAIRPYTANLHLDHIHVQLAAWAYDNGDIAIPAFPGGIVAPPPAPAPPPPPPPPPPPIRSSEENDMPSVFYPPIKQTHTAFIGRGSAAHPERKGHLLHTWTAPGGKAGFEDLNATLKIPEQWPDGKVDVFIDQTDLAMTFAVRAADDATVYFKWIGDFGPWFVVQPIPGRA